MSGPPEVQALSDVVDAINAALTQLQAVLADMNATVAAGQPIMKAQKQAAAQAVAPLVDTLRRAVPQFKPPRYTVGDWNGRVARYSVNDGDRFICEFTNPNEAAAYAQQLNAPTTL